MLHVVSLIIFSRFLGVSVHFDGFFRLNCRVGMDRQDDIGGYGREKAYWTNYVRSIVLIGKTPRRYLFYESLGPHLDTSESISFFKFNRHQACHLSGISQAIE